MKKWYLPLVSIFLLISSCLFGQDIPQAKRDAIEKMFSNVPKRTNMILLTVANNYNDDTFKAVKTLLADYNIFPEKTDTDIGLIKTEEIPLEFGYAKYYIRIIKKDSITQIRLLGYCKTTTELTLGGVTAKSDWQRIENKGMEGSIFLDAFRYMEDIAIGLVANLSINGVEFINDEK